MKVLVLNGRQGRLAKRYRNKVVARLTSRMSRCKNGSRKHRRLAAAMKQVEAKTERRLRDFDHQVSARAEQFTRDVHAHWTAHHQELSGPQTVVGIRLVAGDVRDAPAHRRAGKNGVAPRTGPPTHAVPRRV